MTHDLATFTTLPRLSSFTIYDTPDVDMSKISTKALCLLASNVYEPPKPRGWIRDVLNRAPQMQQLALSARRSLQAGGEDGCYILPLPSSLSSPVSSLVYLDFLDGLTLSDLAYLLSVPSPPAFAAQLTHMALRVHWQDRRVAATLLPSVPALYPSLTHVHIAWRTSEVTNC